MTGELKKYNMEKLIEAFGEMARLSAGS